MPFIRRRRRTYKKKASPARFRRSFRKRAYKGLRFPRNGLVVSPRTSMNPLGFSHTCILRFVENLTLPLPGVNGTVSSDFYLPGSVYDPYGAVGGHQPRGFDQMMLLYKTWQVLGSRLTVRAANNNMTSAYIWGISLVDSTTTVTGNDVSNQVEYPRTVSKLVGGSAGSQNQYTTALSMSYNPMRWFGLKKSSYIGDPDYQGNNSGNASKNAYMRVWYGDNNGGVPSSVFDCQVIIEYKVRFTEPIILAQS